MGSEDQKKLCWECGGEVPFESEQCPFCGAEFEVEAAESSSSPDALSSESSYYEQTPSSYSEPEASSQEETSSPYESLESSYDASHESPYNASSSEENDLFSQSHEGSSDLEPPKPLYEPVNSDLYANASDEANESELFQSQADKSGPFADLQNKSDAPKEDSASADSKSQMLSLCLIIPGLSLLLFGLGMVLFSEEGQLTLRWDASYGLFIFTLSALFMYFGARAFLKIGKK